MQRAENKAPEFLKTYIQKQDILRVLDDVRVEGDVLRKIESIILDTLTRGYVDKKIRPHHSTSAPGISSTTARGIKLGKLSNSVDGFFNSAERVRRRGSIEDRLETLKSEIQNSGNHDMISRIHRFLVETNLASKLTGNYNSQPAA